MLLPNAEQFPWIDTHAHLSSSRFDEDRADVIARMKAAGMVACVTIACDEEELDPLLRLLEQYPGYLYGAWALHPELDQAPEVPTEKLLAVAQHPSMVAVGETGLDFYWCKEPLDWQRARFRQHIAVARRVGKPLIIHARDAESAALDILEREHAGDIGFVMHCFCGTTDEAIRAIDIGGNVSFTGNLTFKRNERLRQAMRALPLERIFLETDCPYMAPVPLRGKRCEPQYVQYIAQTIADVRGIRLEDVARQTTRNAIRFFRLPIQL